MAGLASSALLGSRLPMPTASRNAKKGAATARANKPLRVAAVLEDTSKKNDSLSISKDILDKVWLSRSSPASPTLTVVASAGRAVYRVMGQTPKFVGGRAETSATSTRRQLPGPSLPEPG